MSVLPNGNRISLTNLYQGRAAFLICGGPSLANHDLGKLQQRGVLTMAVNNAAAVVRPTCGHAWTSQATSATPSRATPATFEFAAVAI